MRICKSHLALRILTLCRDIDKVDNTMDSIREEMALTNEISEAISNPVGMGHELDEDELRNELQELEQDELHNRLVGAEAAPAHHISTPTQLDATKNAHADSVDEDAELRVLQAELAM